MPIEPGPSPGQPGPRPGPEAGPEADAAWKRQAKAWREWTARNQRWLEESISTSPYTDPEQVLNSLGVFNEKERGQAAYRRITSWLANQGRLDQGYEYDWASGQKRYVISSDPNAANRWEPITSADYAEYQRQQQYGNDPGAFIRRLQDESKQYYTNLFGNQERLPKNQYGVYVDQRPDGSVRYWDSRGYQTDSTGRQRGPHYTQGGRGGTSGGATSLTQGGRPGGGTSGPFNGFGGNYPGVSGGQGGLGALFGDIGELEGGGFGTGPGGIFGSGFDNLQNELAAQANLDTKKSQFEFERAAKEYASGLPVSNFLRDFYGQVLGVEFPGQDFSVSGMMGGYEGDDGGMMTDQRPGGGGGFPSPLPPGQDPWTPSPPGGAPSGGGINMTDLSRPGRPGGDRDEPDRGGPDRTLVRGAPERVEGFENFDFGGHPVGGHPGVSGMGGGASAGSMGGQGLMAAQNPLYVPFPSAIQGGGYRMTNQSFNPGSGASWGLLGLPAQQIAGDLDNQRAQLERMLPAGGERNLALTNAVNDSYGKLGGLRQGLVSEALGNLGNISQQKMFGVPVGSFSGSANAMLGAGASAYGSNLSAASSANSLAEDQRQFNASLQENRRNRRANSITSIFGGLGSLFGR